MTESGGRLLTRRRLAWGGLGMLLVAVAAIWAGERLWPARREARLLAAMAAAAREPHPAGGLTIGYPLEGTVFPSDIVAPIFRWQDATPGVNVWVVSVDLGGGRPGIDSISAAGSWRPEPDCWAAMKRASKGAAGIRIHVAGGRRDGYVSAEGPARVVLEKLEVCGNCHSFSADGVTLGMDVDYASDKGSYIVTAIEGETRLRRDSIFTWSEVRREDGEPTFGLLSQVSPDGRYVVSTVKDASVFEPVDDRYFSQLFFPFKGILGVHDRTTGSFSTLPGADDPRFVQSSPAWSPDGKTVFYARAKALDTFAFANVSEARAAYAKEFLAGKRGPFRFDVYRIPFKEGRGGEARAVRERA